MIGFIIHYVCYSYDKNSNEFILYNPQINESYSYDEILEHESDSVFGVVLYSSYEDNPDLKEIDFMFDSIEYSSTHNSEDSECDIQSPQDITHFS